MSTLETNKLHTSIRRDSPLPLYHQLKQKLLDQIQKGIINPGEALPSEKELQEMYGVSRITVRRALNDLSLAGYVVRQAGRGTFVLQPKIQHHAGKIGGFYDDIAAQGFQVDSRVLRLEEQPAPPNVARKLGLEAGHRILLEQRVVYASGEPIALGTAYHNFPEGVSFTREELQSNSFITLLKRKYGIILRHADRTTEATVPLDNEAELLGIRPTMPMLLVELVVYDDQGQGVSFQKSLYRGDRYKYYQTITL